MCRFSGVFMENNKRYKKTEELIQNVFIELTETRGYSNVTVKDIVTRCGINRNTFYLHYKDKEDLIDKMVFNILNEQKRKISLIGKELSVKETFKDLLYVVYEQIEFYRILLKDPNLAGYFVRLENDIQEFVIENDDNFKNYPKIKTDYFIHGLLGIINKWIIYDRYSIEEIVNLIDELLVY